MTKPEKQSEVSPKKRGRPSSKQSTKPSSANLTASSQNLPKVSLHEYTPTDTERRLMLNVEAVKKKIGFEPNDWQQGALETLKRFTYIVGGKRCGKSMLTSYLAFRELLAAKRVIWIAAPTYELSTRVWDNIEPWANRFTFLKVRKNDPILGRSIENQVTGSVLRIKSADNPKQLKGDAGDLLIVEECGDMDEEVWPKYLEPFISQTRPQTGQKGNVLFIGNASAKGSWFHRGWSKWAYTAGGNWEDPEHCSWWIPTAIEKDGQIIGSANPGIIEVSELERIKANNSERVWRQEWLAEFLAGTGEVFRNISLCVADTQQGPQARHYYYIGVDLAKHQDWTVLTVIDANTFEVVHIDRFNQIDYPLQKLRIFEEARRWNNATIWIDATGVGDPIFDDLQRMGLDVQPYKFSNASKKSLIEKLSIYIEHAKIKIPNHPDLIRELELYTYEITGTGNTRYGAPNGEHDDMVTSLALAVWPLPEQRSQMPMDNNIAYDDEEKYIADKY